MYLAYISGMYTRYLVPEDVFRNDVRTRNRVSAVTAHRRGLGSLLDPVPQPLEVQRAPHAESKRVFDAEQDRFFSKQSVVQARVDRFSSLAAVSVEGFVVNCCLRLLGGPSFTDGHGTGTL